MPIFFGHSHLSAAHNSDTATVERRSGTREVLNDTSDSIEIMFLSFATEFWDLHVGHDPGHVEITISGTEKGRETVEKERTSPTRRARARDDERERGDRCDRSVWMC